jgi:hypothetical protein
MMARLASAGSRFARSGGMPSSARPNPVIGVLLGAAALVGLTLVWSGVSIAELLESVFK